MERFLWPTEKRSVAHPPPGPWGLILTTGAFNNDELLHYRSSFLVSVISSLLCTKILPKSTVKWDIAIYCILFQCARAF